MTRILPCVGILRHRDGAMNALPVTCNPALAFALRTAASGDVSVAIPGTLAMDEREALLALQLHRYVTL
jgi:hypothetical protein